MTPARCVRTRNRAGALACIAVAATLAAACEHPIGIVTPHIEAADLVVSDSAGTVIVRTEVNRAWLPDSIVLREGQPLRLVLTPIDFRGQPIDITQRRDLSFRMEAENGALLQWEPQRGYGWLRPFAPGVTHLRFLIWHETHADLVTPWLRVVIRPAAHEQSNTPETGNER
jgi:hypothetical protein